MDRSKVEPESWEIRKGPSHLVYVFYSSGLGLSGELLSWSFFFLAFVL